MSSIRGPRAVVFLYAFEAVIQLSWLRDFLTINEKFRLLISKTKDLEASFDFNFFYISFTLGISATSFISFYTKILVSIVFEETHFISRT